jgi:hypothetical protein
MPKPEIPAAFAFKSKPAPGGTSELMAARLLASERMEMLVDRSNEYRATKGVRYAWETTPGAASALKEPPEVKRELLDLDHADGGVEAFVAVQNMLLAFRRALDEADAEDRGVSGQFHPLVARFTDHVMRLAALLTLADDPGALAVDTRHIEDVAVRWMPWLWSGWIAVMGERRRANVEDFLEEGILKNPKGIDLTKTAAVLRAMAKLESEDGPSSVAGLEGSKITEKARGGIKGGKKIAGLGAELRKVLDDLANEGSLVVRFEGGKVDALGKVTPRYRLTSLGQAEAAKMAVN